MSSKSTKVHPSSLEGSRLSISEDKPLEDEEITNSILNNGILSKSSDSTSSRYSNASSTSTNNTARNTADLSQLVVAKRAAAKWKKQSSRPSDGSTTSNSSTAKKKYFQREKEDIRPDRFSPEAYNKLAAKFDVNRVGTVYKINLPQNLTVNTSNNEEEATGNIDSESSETNSDESRTRSGFFTKRMMMSPKNRPKSPSRARLKSLLVHEKSEIKLDNIIRKSGSIIETGLFDVIEYGNKKKYIWDWVIIALTFYSVIVLPLELAFPTIFRQFAFLATLELFTDVFFIFDITLCFRTAYLDEDRFEVKEKSEIKRKYLKGWFKWDMAASLPLEIIQVFFQVSQINKVWLKVNKLVRITRLLKKLDDMALTGYARIMKLLGSFVLAAHVIACFYFTLGRMELEGVTGGRWIDIYEMTDKPVHFQYMSSLYWALATLSTVGYGDVAASSTYERCFALLTMFFGSILYISIFGTFTNLIQEKDRNKSQYNERVEKIKEFSRANHLPSFVKQRLLRYHEASWQLRKVAAGEVLQGVPTSAQIELMMFLYADLVTQVPIFSRCSKRFLEKVVMRFKHSIYLAGDYVIRQGDMGKELYFVVKGAIEIYCSPREDSAAVDFDELVSESFFVARRGPGAFIGEGALLYGKRRGASVLVVSDLVQTLLLTKEDFDDCVKDSPEVVETIRGVAAFRQANASKESSSNLGKTSTSDDNNNVVGSTLYDARDQAGNRYQARMQSIIGNKTSSSSVVEPEQDAPKRTSAIATTLTMLRAKRKTTKILGRNKKSNDSSYVLADGSPNSGNSIESSTAGRRNASSITSSTAHPIKPIVKEEKQVECEITPLVQLESTSKVDSVKERNGSDKIEDSSDKNAVAGKVQQRSYIENTGGLLGADPALIDKKQKEEESKEIGKQESTRVEGKSEDLLLAQMQMLAKTFQSFAERQNVRMSELESKVAGMKQVTKER